MPDTRGFEVVAEVSVEVLREFLKSAWENGGTDAQGAIPHEIPIETGTAFVGYTVDHGQVQIPQEGLSLDMAPGINGVTVGLSTAIQVAMDPDTIPLPSLALFDMTADISVSAPIGIISGTDYNIGVIFEGMPRNDVAVTLTSGDPVGPITTQMISEYIHALWEDETIPHTESRPGASLGIFTADAFVEVFDDPSDTTHQITITQPASDQVKISIPIHLRLSNITASAGPAPISPMGVLARIAITVPLTIDAGIISTELSAATIQIEKFDGTPCVAGDPCADPSTDLCLTGAPDDSESLNYHLNKSGACIFGIDLEGLLISEIISIGQDLMSPIIDFNEPVPGVSDIETFIGDHVHAELLNRAYMGAWTPETPEGSNVEIVDVQPKVLADALAIAINSGDGADANALTDFIPPAQDFAITLDGEFVLQTIRDIINTSEEEGGFGGIPRDFPDIEGYRCRVTSLNPSLRDGAIRFSGEVTIYDVFCKADADCSFWADVGLRWTDPDAEGRQTLEPYLIDSDVDLPWWAWLIAILSFLFGIIIGIVWIVLTAVIDNIAEKVGGAVMEDEVSGHLQALGAWPQELQGIGTVTSTFREEVVIDSQSVMFSGSILISATYYMTSISPAMAGGPHIGIAGSPFHFYGGIAHPQIRYEWDFGDGNTAIGNEVMHTYEDDGLYVLRLTTIVDEPGGATTHHSVWVKMMNAAPVVNAGSDKTIDEGELITYTGTFTDQEWLDTHEATWDFGDDSMPVDASVSETNNPPQASGSATADHAFGDNGVYNATLTVRDKDGGIGKDNLQITVLNVPPKVDAGPDRYAYKDFPIRLIARFTDPGWLDTHVGNWQLGDCSPEQMAVIHEQHQPPQGEGESTVSHVYSKCGDFQVIATVIDDDGGVGQDDFILHVVHLINPNFEEGFHHTAFGVTANGWIPYSLPVKDITGKPVAPAAATPFCSEEFMVNEGQRSQKVMGNGPLRAGIYQHLGTNPCWHYEIQAFYHLIAGIGSCARLGIDPFGGSDPDSDQIVWVHDGPAQEWKNLTSRIEALGNSITIFIEILSGPGLSQIDELPSAAAMTTNRVRSMTTNNLRTMVMGYFDRVSLVPYQVICPQTNCVPICIDFNDMQPNASFTEPFEHHQIKFIPLGEKVRTVTFGEPSGQIKLGFESKGVRMEFPEPVDEVKITVNNYSGRQLYFKIYNEDELIDSFSEIVYNEVREFEIREPEITAISVSGGKNESAIVQICLCLPDLSGENKK